MLSLNNHLDSDLDQRSRLQGHFSVLGLDGMGLSIWLDNFVVHDILILKFKCDEIDYVIFSVNCLVHMQNQIFYFF